MNARSPRPLKIDKTMLTDYPQLAMLMLALADLPKSL
jgi:hypothetical protein